MCRTLHNLPSIVIDKEHTRGSTIQYNVYVRTIGTADDTYKWANIGTAYDTYKRPNGIADDSDK